MQNSITIKEIHAEIGVWKMRFLWIGLAGVVGANLRYFVTITTSNIWTLTIFPVGTLLVNLIGAFMLGFVSSYFVRFAHTNAMIALRTGLIGSFTTFSAFSGEVVELVHSGHGLFAIVYILCSICIGLFLAIIGIRIGEVFQ